MNANDIAALSIDGKAAIFISAFEGFQQCAKWDVNAYRLGHGSDTITFADGTYRKVKQGDCTTRENAQRDLQRRIRLEFIPRLKSQLGESTYNALPYPALVGLLSLSYNYGSITHPSIITAARSLNVNRLADTLVSSTYNDNKDQSQSVRNALRNRRQKEADFIRLAVKQTTQAGFGFAGAAIALGIALALLSNNSSQRA